MKMVTNVNLSSPHSNRAISTAYAFHLEYRAWNVAQNYTRIRHDSAVGLRSLGAYLRRYLGCRVADVDLAAGDVVLHAVKGGALGQAVDTKSTGAQAAQATLAPSH